MKDTIVLKKNKDMISRVVDNELILVPLYKTNEDINCIYTLNKVAAKIWECINDKSTVGKIRQKLLEYYGIEPEKLNKALNEFIRDLKEIKAIQ